MNSLMIGDARVNSSAAYSEGNLKVAGGGFTSSSVGGGYSTIAIPKDKKIYIEVCETATTGDLWSAGILIDNHAMNSTTIGGNGSIAYYNRSVYVNGSETDYGASAGIGGLVTYYVGTSLPHAEAVEYGTGPHSAETGTGEFMQSIIEWTDRVLGYGPAMANSIAKNIRKKGIEPRPYFRRALVKEAPNFKLTWSLMLAERLEAEAFKSTV